MPVPVLVVLLVLLDEAELDELVPQPTALGSHLHATHAEPCGSRRHPAAGPQAVVASQPMRVQNHSSWPTSARQSGASGKAAHSLPPGVQYRPTPFALPGSPGWMHIDFPVPVLATDALFALDVLLVDVPAPPAPVELLSPHAAATRVSPSAHTIFEPDTS